MIAWPASHVDGDESFDNDFIWPMGFRQYNHSVKATQFASNPGCNPVMVINSQTISIPYEITPEIQTEIWPHTLVHGLGAWRATRCAQTCETNKLRTCCVVYLCCDCVCVLFTCFSQCCTNVFTHCALLTHSAHSHKQQTHDDTYTHAYTRTTHLSRCTITTLALHTGRSFGWT